MKQTAKWNAMKQNSKEITIIIIEFIQRHMVVTSERHALHV